MSTESHILCYPNFNLNDLDGIKCSLLLGDRVSVIAPSTTPHYQVPMIPAAALEGDPGRITQYGTDISPSGALDGLQEGCRLDDGSHAIEFIDDVKIAKKRGEEFLSALNRDLDDSKVANWEKRARSRHPDRDYAWYVNREYFVYLGLEDADHPRYGLEPIKDDRLGDLIKVPFVVGMSLGLSEAMWAAVDGDLSLFTTDPLSADFLLLRLRRGWTMLSSDLALQRDLDIKLAKDFATSKFGARTLRFAVPKIFDKIAALSPADVVQLRRETDAAALSAFREGMAKIVADESLWRAKDYQTFRQDAERAADVVLKPALEALNRKRMSPREIMTTTFNPATMAKGLTAGIPRLFVSAPTALAAGTIAITGGVAIVPAVLFAIGCGILGDGLADYINKERERLAEQRSARFLTYPVGLGGAG